MKLWHDDIRRPPDDSWVWARTNEEAIAFLEGLTIHEISLDHDLGLHELDPDTPDAIYLVGHGEETGLDLVDYMIARALVPDKVTVHSMNPVGADRMCRTLNARGYDCYRRPYQVPESA